MSDTVQSSTFDLEQLIGEVQAEHRARFTREPAERFKPSEYAGLKISRLRRKYAKCEVYRGGNYSLRKLTPREIAEFRAGVAKAIEAREP